MIRTIKKSELDNEKVCNINSVANDGLNEFDFSKVVVKKPWGREYLTYKGDETDIWVLYIKKDHGTSIHCHPNKKTNLIVLGGEVICATLKEEYTLKEGDTLILEKGVFHSTKAISKKGALVMELESPPMKTDLIRLKDIYGREEKGYEPQSDMCFDLSEYERVFLNESDTDRKIGNMNISLKDFTESEPLKNFINLNKNFINILIAGELVDNNGNKLIEVGDILDLENLNKFEEIRIKRTAKIMNLKKNIFDED